MSADAPEMIDRFELLEQCGQGGMGSVYRARDTVIDRTVALKIIELGGGAEADLDTRKSRVLREARAAGKLSHQNIVTVHDAGEWDDRAWIVMEFVEGAVFDPAKSTPSETVRLLRQAAAALDYAHSRGIIHRDVKPSNLLLAADGVAKLADFGIAKLVAADQLTRPGSLLGTPNYMSPEQLREKDVGPAADQFSLAVMAYEALARKKPFEAESVSGLLVKILQQDPAKASSHNPELPPPVDAVLSRALSKESSKRFADCATFVESLASSLALEGETTPTPEPDVSRGKLIGAIAAAVLLCAAGWYALSDARQAEPVVAAPPPVAVQPETEIVPAEPEPSAPPEIEPAPAPRTPPPAAPQQTAPAAPAAPRYAASGATVSVVWSGSLEPNQVLTIDSGQPDQGSLSRDWPTGPVEVEVSPSAIAIVEAPSEANGWRRLRLRNSDAARSLVILRYRQMNRVGQ